MKTLFPRLVLAALVAMAFSFPMHAADSPSVLLQKGIYAEETEGNVDAAIKIYEQIAAEAATNRAVVAQAQYRLAVCYQKKGNKEQAIKLLNELVQQFPSDAAVLRKARSTLTELGAPAAEGRSLLAGDSEATSPASRLLQNTAFPTLAAEDLAADYLEHDPAPATTDAKLQRTPLAKVWRLPSADRTVVALFREERLVAELEKFLEPLVLPDVRVKVLAPNIALTAHAPALSQDAGELLPGWRLALSFHNGDPLAEASARQTRFYLWMGVGVVLIIAVVALLVARYVAAQMRLARLKNELVSTVSHELKTPLASMRALVDTLAAGRFRDEQQLQEYLQLIAKENLRLCHLIENFLAFSRMERGQQRFKIEELAPAAVLRSAIDAVKDKLEAPRCRFEVQAGTELPHIRGDAEALATVLINLLDNACKYTNGDKRIAARAYALNHDVWFEVEDNGIGLAPDDTRKIFDRFYQVDQSLTRQRGGCGLGLSIVKFIVEAHNGTVEVRSVPGEGSTFRVRIPVAEPIA